MSALHTSAVDPVTGLIDMDLVNTGISSRRRIQNMRNAELLTEYFTDIKRTSIKATEAYEEFEKLHNLKLDYATFSRIVNDLVEGGHLVRKGTGSSEILYTIG